MDFTCSSKFGEDGEIKEGWQTKRGRSRYKMIQATLWPRATLLEGFLFRCQWTKQSCASGCLRGVTMDTGIPEGFMGLDCGPKSIEENAQAFVSQNGREWHVYIYIYIIVIYDYIYIYNIHTYSVYLHIYIYTVYTCIIFSQLFLLEYVPKTDSICSLFTRRSGSRLLVSQAVKESKTIIWNGVLNQLALTQKLLQESSEVILGMAVRNPGAVGVGGLWRPKSRRKSMSIWFNCCQGPMGVFEMSKFETGTSPAMQQGHLVLCLYLHYLHFHFRCSYIVGVTPTMGIPLSHVLQVPDIPENGFVQKRRLPYSSTFIYFH